MFSGECPRQASEVETSTRGEWFRCFASHWCEKLSCRGAFPNRNHGWRIGPIWWFHLLPRDSPCERSILLCWADITNRRRGLVLSLLSHGRMHSLWGPQSRCGANISTNCFSSNHTTQCVRYCGSRPKEVLRWDSWYEKMEFSRGKLSIMIDTRFLSQRAFEIGF